MSEPPDMSAEARRWIGQAVEDLAAARRIAADPDLPPRLVALQAALPEDDAASLTEIRLLFVFDVTSNAVLLVAGDKAGNWKRWYAEAIPLAEQRTRNGSRRSARE